MTHERFGKFREYIIQLKSIVLVKKIIQIMPTYHYIVHWPSAFFILLIAGLVKNNLKNKKSHLLKKRIIMRCSFLKSFRTIFTKVYKTIFLIKITLMEMVKVCLHMNVDLNKHKYTATCIILFKIITLQRILIGVII